MTIVNGNKIQQVKINKEDATKASVSIIDNNFNTLWMNIKGEHLTTLKVKSFEELQDKNIKAICFKNGTFLNIDDTKPFSILDKGEEYAEIIDAIDNVLVVKIDTNKTGEKIIIVKTSKNAIMKIKNKNITLNKGLDSLMGKNINLYNISIFKSKEGQVYYSLKENGTIKLVDNK